MEALVEIKQQDLLEHINSLNWCLLTTTFPCSCFHAPVATIRWQMLEYCRSVCGNVLGFFKRWLIQYIQSATSFVIADTWHPFVYYTGTHTHSCHLISLCQCSTLHILDFLNFPLTSVLHVTHEIFPSGNIANSVFIKSGMDSVC